MSFLLPYFYNINFYFFPIAMTSKQANQRSFNFCHVRFSDIFFRKNEKMTKKS
ncbi:hypothetical protein STRMA_0562 [Streptococcus macacae NCTC 11558]|uniref:Uncharacterized protein n=1 Tax=Streptococcus macacae NCTC 11558 TaxID=764298 RepID=G5JU22_9STRE|nr:hypothetical protein STRMA_0562 [Streptococcus macacae NCTC 11558]